MKTVGVRALKQNASTVVADAARGEVIVITARGARVAQLGPIPTDPIEALIASGRARPARRTFASLGATPRRSRGESEIGATLAEMREDERY